MKKYLLGIFAVILAVGLMSFEPLPSPKANTTDYFWYDVITGDLIEPSPSPEPANECKIIGGAVCAYGHLEELDPEDDPSMGFDEEARYQ